MFFSSPRSDDELAYKILFDPRQQNMISQDLILDYNHPLLKANNHCHNNNVNNCSSSSRKRKQSGTLLLASAKTHPEKADGDGDDKVKKIVHRDMERRRRKEMATLYASLRSLLPLEYVNKKKRSVSDHMYEAVNYIKKMHNNMKELERRRDSIISHAIRSKTNSPGYVSVSRCRDGGMEILVDTGCKLDERFPLSTLLRTLLSEGLEAVSCVSTKTSHGRLLHKIHSKVCGEICVDVRALQQKLSCVINPAMWTQSLMVS